jgi:hypothetical protein
MENPKKREELMQNPSNQQNTALKVNKASTKETLVMIYQQQQRHSEAIGELKVNFGKLEQKIEDYIADKKEDECRDDKRREQNHSNIKWIVGFIISTVLGVASFLWGVFG